MLSRTYFLCSSAADGHREQSYMSLWTFKHLSSLLIKLTNRIVYILFHCIYMYRYELIWPQTRENEECLSLTRLPVGAFIGNAMQNTENARRFVHLARTSIISSLNPNESSPGRAGKALEKREAERVSGSGWRAAHTRRAGGRVSQSRKGLRS